MKYFPEPRHVLEPGCQTLSEGLQGALSAYREQRAFSPMRYVKDKRALIARYMDHYGLTRVVLGISGGVDSAVTLALLAGVEGIDVIPVFFLNRGEGVTNQSDSLARARSVTDTFDKELIVEEGITALCERAGKDIASVMGIEESPWSRGQLFAYQRTPLLYYMATLSTQSGEPAVVGGTINRDEGGYLGYVGKASDGMVDIQFISDLHKSEVYAVARFLGVPEVVLDATPSGDMHDGRTDEDVFGAPYDFVELYTGFFLQLKDAEREAALSLLAPGDRSEYDFYAGNLEGLHRYNLHKYISSSPAVHLDILPASVPGGWQNKEWRES